MGKIHVEMGNYYRTNSYGLVRTVCRAIDAGTGEVMTVFVKVGGDGCVSDTFVMPELEFENLFISPFMK